MPDSARFKAVTGELTEAEIRAVSRSPVRSMTHTEAVDAIRADRVVALHGPPGSGKEHGGTAVLAELGPKKIFVLTPGPKLDELASRTYQKGCGYLVEAVEEGNDRRYAADAWRRTRTRLTECEAWLLTVTSDEERPETGAAEAMRHLRWSRPDVREIVASHDLDAATVDAVLAELPDDPAIGSVVQVAGLVAGGREPAAAVREAFGLAARAAVQSFFDRKPPRDEVCATTVLAMTQGLRWRDHGRYLMRFENVLAEYIPRPRPGEESPDLIPDLRAAIVRGDGLVTLDRVVRNGVASKQLRFKDPSYRAHVLRHLWENYDERFLSAVLEWVHEIVADDEVRFHLAIGLATLAREAYDEVEFDYLRPWAEDRCGWQGQQAAIWVLSVMSTDLELSKAALHTATNWVSYGSWPQRWTGAVAFTGQLGVRYPEEAARRLWQLIAQRGPISGAVAQSMGQLVATLVLAEGKAGKVLGLLDRKLDQLSVTGKDASKYRLAMRAVLAVLSTKVPGGKPAIVMLLLARPDLRPLICRIWATALRFTPARRGALRSLGQALQSLERFSLDAEREATALGNALRLELIGDERRKLRQDLPIVMAHGRSGRAHPSPLTKILLAALDAAAHPHGK
ncbi:hypothetical protein ACH35V_01900 [Actinomadura sp. 1N219]|uniref:hypothetical protein n=1 Tax=Actinomadura sp. 1N219 TaxID=3375152 RepID=UPI00379B74C5